MKRIMLIIAATLLLAGCGKEYVCPDGGTAPSREACPGYGMYVRDYALTLEDLPSGFLIDDGETGPQLGSEVDIGDLERGWKEGYFCGFMRPEEGIVVEGVYCFVSRYDQTTLQGLFTDTANVTAFDAPAVGDASVAYFTYDADADVSSYTVELVKGDVYAGVTVESVGKRDLGEDAVRYATIVASRIP